MFGSVPGRFGFLAFESASVAWHSLFLQNLQGGKIADVVGVGWIRRALLGQEGPAQAAPLGLCRQQVCRDHRWRERQLLGDLQVAGQLKVSLFSFPIDCFQPIWTSHALILFSLLCLLFRLPENIPVLLTQDIQAVGGTAFQWGQNHEGLGCEGVGGGEAPGSASAGVSAGLAANCLRNGPLFHAPDKFLDLQAFFFSMQVCGKAEFGGLSGISAGALGGAAAVLLRAPVLLGAHLSHSTGLQFPNL